MLAILPALTLLSLRSAPAQFLCKAVISDMSGPISTPTIRTLDGEKASIGFQDNSSEARFEITPRIDGDKIRNSVKIKISEQKAHHGVFYHSSSSNSTEISFEYSAKPGKKSRIVISDTGAHVLKAKDKVHLEPGDYEIDITETIF